MFGNTVSRISEFATDYQPRSTALLVNTEAKGVSTWNNDPWYIKYGMDREATVLFLYFYFHPK